MSRRIASLLGESEQTVAKLIDQLESKNGYPSHDVRLLAENIQKIRAKIADLGLDPDDTTAQELYHALLIKFDCDSNSFNRRYRVEGLGFDEKMAKAAALVNSLAEMPQQWAVKISAAKNLLKQQPPKRVMKCLHYRSADSMLKREDVIEILLAAKQLESAAWQKAFNRQVSGLDQANIEMRTAKIQALSFKRWAGIEGPADFSLRDDSLGVVSIWPSDKLTKAPLLTMVLLIFEELGEYQYFNNSGSLTKMVDILNWWGDMDHLIADLADEPVSLNLKDNALNALFKIPYDQRELNRVKKGFWQELLSRYENLPEIDGLFDDSFKEKVAKLNFTAPEPVYEFAEDF